MKEGIEREYSALAGTCSEVLGEAAIKAVQNLAVEVGKTIEEFKGKLEEAETGRRDAERRREDSERSLMSSLATLKREIQTEAQEELSKLKREIREEFEVKSRKEREEFEATLQEKISRRLASLPTPPPPPFVPDPRTDLLDAKVCLVLPPVSLEIRSDLDQTPSGQDSGTACSSSKSGRLLIAGGSHCSRKSTSSFLHLRGLTYSFPHFTRSASSRTGRSHQSDRSLQNDRNSRGDPRKSQQPPRRACQRGFEGPLFVENQARQG